MMTRRPKWILVCIIKETTPSNHHVRMHQHNLINHVDYGLILTNKNGKLNHLFLTKVECAEFKRNANFIYIDLNESALHGHSV